MAADFVNDLSLIDPTKGFAEGYIEFISISSPKGVWLGAGPQLNPNEDGVDRVELGTATSKDINKFTKTYMMTGTSIPTKLTYDATNKMLYIANNYYYTPNLSARSAGTTNALAWAPYSIGRLEVEFEKSPTRSDIYYMKFTALGSLGYHDYAVYTLPGWKDNTTNTLTGAALIAVPASTELEIDKYNPSLPYRYSIGFRVYQKKGTPVSQPSGTIPLNDDSSFQGQVERIYKDYVHVRTNEIVKFQTLTLKEQANYAPPPSYFDITTRFSDEAVYPFKINDVKNELEKLHPEVFDREIDVKLAMMMKDAKNKYYDFLVDDFYNELIRIHRTGVEEMISRLNGHKGTSGFGAWVNTWFEDQDTADGFQKYPSFLLTLIVDQGSPMSMIAADMYTEDRWAPFTYEAIKLEVMNRYQTNIPEDAVVAKLIQDARDRYEAGRDQDLTDRKWKNWEIMAGLAVAGILGIAVMKVL